jgi:hypothetical protein
MIVPLFAQRGLVLPLVVNHNDRASVNQVRTVASRSPPVPHSRRRYRWEESMLGLPGTRAAVE